MIKPQPINKLLSTLCCKERERYRGVAWYSVFITACHSKGLQLKSRSSQLLSGFIFYLCKKLCVEKIIKKKIHSYGMVTLKKERKKCIIIGIAVSLMLLYSTIILSLIMLQFAGRLAQRKNTRFPIKGTRVQSQQRTSHVLDLRVNLFHKKAQNSINANLLAKRQLSHLPKKDCTHFL